MQHPDAPPAFARDGINLAHPRLGAVVLTATDEFFAAKERMLDPEPAVFHPGRFDAHGKWMDGWETRRRRGGGHDVAVVRLGVPGVIRGFDIDTSHFTGNYPPAASVVAWSGTGDPGPDAGWTEILPPSPLGPSAHHYFNVDSEAVWTHLGLHIWPDGGVARFRVYGEPSPPAADAGVIDLAATVNGGKAVAWNDAHYGHPDNILGPGRGVDMGDGWETRRRREPGNDWIIVQLGDAAAVERVVVDTAHFKGNYPDRCSLQAANLPGVRGLALRDMVVTQAMFWDEFMAPQKLEADSVHEFGPEVLRDLGPVTHVKLNVFPDGGISRLRVFGRRAGGRG
ncbi:MAG: allantoicase [Geminicoccaceae bacterium]|nr:allantoicase [Geminicoccaceae bacterium]